MKTFRVTTNTLNQIDDHIRLGEKIPAIKALREEHEGASLRDLKNAIDKRSGRSHPTNAMDIKPMVSIKSVTIDLGEGTVELSLDEMNMMTLVGMQKLGIDETRRVLDLHDMLVEWEKNITMSPSEKKEEE
jgi:hypothetical protein